MISAMAGVNVRRDFKSGYGGAVLVAVDRWRALLGRVCAHGAAPRLEDECVEGQYMAVLLKRADGLQLLNSFAGEKALADRKPSSSE